MSQWYDPMKTPEGQLLQEVQELLKSVKDKKKPKGYKSDRGDREMPRLPSPKGNTNKLASDMSDNCPLCGANPHEECGMPGRSGEHQAINCKLNPIAFDSRMDDLREPESMREHMDEGHRTNVRKPASFRGMVQTSNDQITQDIAKYEQEPNGSNSVPQFQNVDGGVPVLARGFTTNQRLPHFEDGIKKKVKKPETVKTPLQAQTGYTAKSSSLHMHLNDGGNSGTPPNIARIEEKLMSITKQAGFNNMGLIGEIEAMLKAVKEHIGPQ
jgi:hypothetical protein